MSGIKLEVERDAGMAYITLSTAPVAQTMEHSSTVMVDLDALNVAVGIELLDLDATIPYDDLVTLYHVDSSVIEILKLIRPTINSFVQHTKSITEDGVVSDNRQANANGLLV